MTDFEVLIPALDAAARVPRKRSATKSSSHGKGCEGCPQNNVHGIHKVLGSVRGKEIFVWAQSPGKVENDRQIELVGPAGRWLWGELEKVGIAREDCDIQNAVRCLPADRDGDAWVLRDPTREEIRCCSFHTENAIAQSRAKIHLILGRIAGKAVLGPEYRKDDQVLWSEKLHAKVVVLDHPAYFLRGAPKERLARFRRGLRLAKLVVEGKEVGPFATLEQQDYRGVTTLADVRLVCQTVREKAKNRRIALDLEWGTVGGEEVILCVGVCWKPSISRVIALDHPGVVANVQERRVIRKLVVELLSDPTIRWALHHGSSDDGASERLLGTPIAGYDYDTIYAEYIARSGQRRYSLDEISRRRFPEFADYKNIRFPEALLPEDRAQYDALKSGVRRRAFLEKIERSGKFDLSRLSWEKMVLYNGADCDITKRIELSTKNQVPLPLLAVYRDVAYVTDRMEKWGPLFDYDHYERLAKLYPVRVRQQVARLRMLAEDPEFNPASPSQVSRVVYDKLHLLDGDETGRKTDRETLQPLAAKSEFAKTLLAYRKDSKVVGTYLEGFKNSADKHAGRLRTIWWLTGTVTGRLRSGGGSGKSREAGIVNLQNVHGDPALQNLLVSDVAWRKVLGLAKKYGAKPKRIEGWLPAAKDLRVFLSADYSQIEIRMLAALSGDETLIRAICAGGDLHSEIGHAFTGWSVEKIKSDKRIRRIIKEIHFGIVYGLNEEGVYLKLCLEGVVGVTREEVSDYYQKYFQRFPKVRRYIEECRRLGEEQGWVETMFGFRRRLSLGDDGDADQRGTYWGNQAINSPVQGGAHQLMLIAMALLKRNPDRYPHLVNRLQLEVHDALDFNVKLGNLAAAQKELRQLMEKDVLDVVRTEFKKEWPVPLQIEMSAGFRFGVQVEVTTPLSEWLASWLQKNATESAYVASLLRGEEMTRDEYARLQ